MKKATKYFSLFFAALLMIPVFGVRLSAHEEKNIGAEEAVLKTPAYRSQVEKIIKSMVKEDGLYKIHFDKLAGVDSEILAKTQKIIDYMNHDQKIMNIISDLNNKKTNVEINFVDFSNIDPFGFGNEYWWGYAYTYTNADLQWAAGTSVDVGGWIVALADLVPFPNIQGVMDVLGVAFTTVGAGLINAKYFTINWAKIYGVTIPVPGFSIEW